MDEQTKISQMALKFGLSLVNSGYNITRNASSRIQRNSYPNAMIKNFLSDQTGIPLNAISLADEKYYLTNWERVQEIIDADWTNTFKYAIDVFDCENFAFLFASEGGNLYGFNSFGVAFGEIYDAKTGALLFGHGFNLLLTLDKGVMNLRLYEPQTDECSLWKKGQNNIGMGSKWIYKPKWLIFF